MNPKTLTASLIYLVSLVFFLLGLFCPIMSSDILMGWVAEKEIYLVDSVSMFFEEGEYFLAIIILLFSLVFPILKYLVIGLKIVKVPFPGYRQFGALLDFINKWAMLDVFVVALVIINMKTGHSLVISTNLEIGTTFFAASIVLLMISNWILKIQRSKEAFDDLTPEKTDEINNELSNLLKNESPNTNDSNELS